jgi:uncharacterized protein involved in exopolysaccharide biosynthesis
MPGAREAEEILALWREIERNLAAAPRGSPEAERLQSDAALLRDEYQRLVQVAREHAGEAPGPSPEPAGSNT